MTHTVIMNIYKNEITSELSKTHNEEPGHYMKSSPEPDGVWSDDYGELFATMQLLKQNSLVFFSKAQPYCTSYRISVRKLFFMKPLVVEERYQYGTISDIGCSFSLYQPDTLRSLQKFGLITNQPVYGRSIGRIRDSLDSSVLRVADGLDNKTRRDFESWNLHRSEMREKFDALIDVDDGAALLSWSHMLIVVGMIALFQTFTCAIFAWEWINGIPRVSLIGLYSCQAARIRVSLQLRLLLLKINFGVAFICRSLVKCLRIRRSVSITPKTAVNLVKFDES